VVKLGEGAEGAFVRLKDAMKTLDVLERRRFLLEFADVWLDQDSALYTDAIHSVEMGTLYLKYSGEQLITECIAKARRQLGKLLEIKDPAKRGEFVSFGLIGTIPKPRFFLQIELFSSFFLPQKKARGSHRMKHSCNDLTLSVHVIKSTEVKSPYPSGKTKATASPDTTKLG